ncbi:MAG: shikimate kinase [Candidatus Omnitrophica bacterium]|nr:shikimate kinase [Candidatus Omnitrophota bacterium]MCM8790947.1 shikimate kinase [Candidatus Omnitrophota bacterium]
MKNIVLIGFMGTGKTTIATRLAHRLGMKYVSTDDLIERRERRTINEIFKSSGEDYFRDVESSVIRDICCIDGQVIDTGGGAVIRDENLSNLKSNGIVICLTADEQTIMERTKKYKHRPLLNCEDPKRRIKDLLAKRAPLYARADHTIDTGKLTVRQVVEEIVRIVEESKSKKS